VNKGVGITERGDAGLDFTWESKIDKYNFSILITKNLNNEFINKVKDLNNIIIHATITGYGGSVLEPNVPTPIWSLAQLEKLSKSFPIERIILRTDPIMPTAKGVKSAVDVMRLGIEIGVKRIRFSYVDTYYRHVQKRFSEAGIELPPKHPSDSAREPLIELMMKNSSVRFESCAENIVWDVGCISPYDFDLFGIEPNTENINAQNRTNCKCLACKVELLNYKNNKRCPHQCLYCYWKD
jgi:DNA repair photolyase